MTYPKRPRSSQKNGARWAKISGVAKRAWARQGIVLCHLCGHVLDEDAPSRSDRSISIDHVVPVSQDPSLEYTLSNLKPACLICNLVRQDRPVEEVYNDVHTFKREVDRAIARRELDREAKADKAAKKPTGPRLNTVWSPAAASSRDWL